MDPAVAGALIGVGGTAVGSLGSQLITLRRDRERDRQERERARAEEERAERAALREALEEAALALRKARAAVDDVLLKLGPLDAARGDWGVSVNQWIDDSRANVFALMRAESRLGLYLRDDEMLDCLSQALSILEQCSEETIGFDSTPRPEGGRPLPLGFLGDQRQKLMVIEEQFREKVHNMEASSRREAARRAAPSVQRE